MKYPERCILDCLVFFAIRRLPLWRSLWFAQRCVHQYGIANGALAAIALCVRFCAPAMESCR